MRLALSFLLCFLSLSLLAGVVCIQQNDATWVCSGSVDVPPAEVITNILDGTGIVISNDVGVCTNCISVTPQACEDFKEMFTSYNNTLLYTLADLEHSLFESYLDIQSFIDEGKTFTYNSYVSSQKPPEYASMQEWITSQPQYAYYINYVLGNSYNTLVGGGVNNSIYVYFNERVLPFLEDLSDSIDNNLNNLYPLEGQVSAFSRYVDSTIHCEACTIPLKFDDTGGGGGGDGDSGGGCPCKEQFEALKQVLLDMAGDVWSLTYSVEDIKGYLDSIHSTLADGFGKVHNYQEKSNLLLGSISNTVYRLDSYVQTDLDEMVRELGFLTSNTFEKVSHIADTLDKFGEDFFEQFVYANEFKDKKGAAGVNSLVDVQTNFVSEGEYRNLPWFLRMELLLLKLVHPFEDDDSFGASDSQQDEANELVNDLKELDPSEKVESFKQETGTVLDNLKSTVRNVAGVFDVASLPPSVELMHQGEWIGDSPLVLNVDPYIADNSRLIFGLVWSCLALFLFVKVWLGVVRIVLPVFDFIRKLLRFALKA